MHRRPIILRLAPVAVLAFLGIVLLAPFGVAAEPASPDLPTRLVIPAIEVDAPIGAVGLAEDGTMATPSGPYDVAWFAPSARPGEPGNAVLAGHRDYRGVGPAVFWRLGDLAPGDIIWLDDAGGARRAFEVEAVERYAEADAPMDRIFGLTGATNLNLITCAGVFDPSRRNYDERVVVYARLAVSDTAG